MASGQRSAGALGMGQRHRSSEVALYARIARVGNTGYSNAGTVGLAREYPYEHVRARSIESPTPFPMTCLRGSGARAEDFKCQCWMWNNAILSGMDVDDVRASF